MKPTPRSAAMVLALCPTIPLTAACTSAKRIAFSDEASATIVVPAVSVPEVSRASSESTSAATTPSATASPSPNSTSTSATPSAAPSTTHGVQAWCTTGGDDKDLGTVHILVHKGTPVVALQYPPDPHYPSFRATGGLAERSNYDKPQPTGSNPAHAPYGRFQYLQAKNAAGDWQQIDFLDFYYTEGFSMLNPNQQDEVQPAVDALNLFSNEWWPHRNAAGCN
jgi:hypothetical protein